MKKKREDEMQIFCFKSVDLKTIIYQVEKKNRNPNRSRMYIFHTLFIGVLSL
jgi:hypothetical protein